MAETRAEVISFQDAINLTHGLERDILIGNGFSMAAHDGFDYRRLLDRASVPEDVRGIFASARTSNFEAVMRIILAETANASPEARFRAAEKIVNLKQALIRSIHEVHPPRRTEIPQPRWDHCEQFLEYFIGRKRKGRIFTTNYDLLLSWAVAPDRDRGKNRRLNAYEGFRGGPYDGLGAATIIYLHGALHLASDGLRSYQLQYRDTGVALHDQIAERLRRREFPIFVSEGASAQKVPAASGFLRDALAAFRGTCKTPAKKALFTLGHSLGPEDQHIVRLIPKWRIPTVYLGAYGAKEIGAFQDIAASWSAVRAATEQPPLKVYIFDSTDVVWGPRSGA